MLKTAEVIPKLKGLLQNEYPHLSEQELQSIAQNLYDLGLFLVRQEIKKHSKPEDKDIFTKEERPP